MYVNEHNYILDVQAFCIHCLHKHMYVWTKLTLSDRQADRHRHDKAHLSTKAYSSCACVFKHCIHPSIHSFTNQPTEQQWQIDALSNAERQEDTEQKKSNNDDNKSNGTNSHTHTRTWRSTSTIQPAIKDIKPHAAQQERCLMLQATIKTWTHIRTPLPSNPAQKSRTEHHNTRESGSGFECNRWITMTIPAEYRQRIFMTNFV